MLEYVGLATFFDPEMASTKHELWSRSFGIQDWADDIRVLFCFSYF